MSKRLYRNAATMRSVYHRYEQSGLTIKQFCLQENIKIHCFQYWKRKFLREGVEEESEESGFDQIIPIKERSSLDQGILFRLGNKMELELPTAYPIGQLVQLVKALC